MTTYKHFKGGRYELITEATHTETSESLTVYQSLEDGSVWARPSGMFHDHVYNEGAMVPRFTKETGGDYAHS